MENETLLPIHRNFTDKEKIGLAHKKYNELERKFKNILIQNENLAYKNKQLSDKLKAYEEEIPETLNGKTEIKAQTFLRLRKRYTEMVANFWRVNDELMVFKKQIKSEQL